MNNKQITLTAFMWLVGHCLVYLLYLKLSYAFVETISQVLLVNVFHGYAHYRLSLHHASKLWPYL
jgi:hypothetical protein